MINKKQFIKLIDDYKKFYSSLSKYEILLNLESPIFLYIDDLWNTVLLTNFNHEQIDWINWWLYEYDNGCKAYKNKVEIDLDSVDKLWDFIQKV